MLSFLQVVVADFEVNFCHFNDEVSSMQILKLPPRHRPIGGIASPADDDIYKRDRKDPLVGKPVTIGGKHIFSGYHGLVKVVCGNANNLQIELEATTRVVEVPRANIFIRF
jgi:transcription elongation factor